MNIFAKAAQLEQSNIPFAFANIIETKGSSPRHSGTMLIEEGGQIHGTIGGGMIERYVIEQAVEAIKENKPRVVTGRMTRNGPDAMGMDCGGAMTLSIDVYGTRPRLFLIGAGHVNRAIAQVATHLGFDITVADAYEASLAEQHFPEGTHRVLGNNMLTAIQSLDINENSYVIIATNHQDQDAINAIAQQPTAYTGLMASRKKVQTLFQGLRELGTSQQQIQHIHSPIGFDIGAETPEEIAISVMAEVLNVKNGASGFKLKDHVGDFNRKLVLIRGAGDIATGVAARLHNSGFKVVMTDIEHPTMIRCSVSFGQCLYGDPVTVEGIQAVKVDSFDKACRELEKGNIPVFVDETGKLTDTIKPDFLVDAILAKKNLGTHKAMAPVTIALGPGFHAGKDCHAAIETNRGHQLGRVIYDGPCQPNSGIPGSILGYTEQRVIRAPQAGTFVAKVVLGDIVEEGQEIASIDDTVVYATLSGKVRGLLNSGLQVHEGFKIGDIDPRGTSVDHCSISDKARAVAGGVLEAMLSLSHQQ